MTQQDMTDEEFVKVIDQITADSQKRIENIINAYESFLRDESALKEFSVLLGEIPMISGDGNEHKKDA
jgi:hypothetical protein